MLTIKNLDLRHMITKRLKYFIVVVFFSFIINVLYLAFPLYLIVMFDKVLNSYSLPSLITLTVGSLFAFFILSSLAFIRSKILIQIGLSLDQSLNIPILHAMFDNKHSLQSHGMKSGIDDLDILRNYFGTPSLAMLFDSMWIPVFAAVIFFLNFDLGLLSLAGILGMTSLWFLQHLLVRKRWDQARALHTLGQKSLDAPLQHAETIRAMGMEKGILEYFQSVHQQEVGLKNKSFSFAVGIQSLSTFLRMAIQVVIFGLGVYLIFAEQITAGMAVATMIILGRCLFPLEQVLWAWQRFVEARGAYKRLNRFLKQTNSHHVMELPAPDGKLDVNGAGLLLAGNYVLRNISFSLSPGEFLGVIGPCGAGKSVLLKLVLGIWPAQGGKVRLDGADVFQWAHQDLGSFLGYMAQDVCLFSGSVSQNIARMGEIDPKLVVTAAQKAGLHESILRLPQGYDTEIGEEGKKLSAGQRRLLGLARAVYNDPRVIVLDEPNANLDEPGERALTSCLKQLKKEKVTLVVTTHKAALLNYADKVLLLKDGQTALYGPRQEVFQRIMDQQNNPQASHSTT